MKNEDKSYYVCYLRSDNSVFISTALQQIADYLSLHRNTISKHLNNSDKYVCNKYILWKNVHINTIKRGFALKNRQKI